MSAPRRLLSLCPEAHYAIGDTDFVVYGPLDRVRAPWRQRTGQDTPAHLLREPAVARQLWARGLLNVSVMADDEVAYVIHPRRHPPVTRPQECSARWLDPRAQVTVGAPARGDSASEGDRGHWWLSVPTSWADIEIVDDALLARVKLAAAGHSAPGRPIDEAFDRDLAWTEMTRDTVAAPWWDHAAAHLHSQTVRYGRQMITGTRRDGSRDRVAPMVHEASTLEDLPLDPTFDEVLARRRSMRLPARAALTAPQLMELLRSVMLPRPDGHRTYPSAGDGGELSLAVTVGEVPGLDGGLYRYDHQADRLDHVCGSEHTEIVLLTAGHAMRSAPPPALITVLTDFRDITQLYSPIGYPLALRNTGVLLAHLHLTATRLGLGSCLIGAGDARYLARMLGDDVFATAATGDIAVGTGNAADG